MHKRVAVVTGGNKGIGYQIVKALCTHFSKEITNEEVIVYLTSRDTTRGSLAIQQLLDAGLYPKFHNLDIESKTSVTEFADFIRKSHGGLDILINNAAISYFTNPRAPLIEQAERTIAVNYYGTLSVCQQLFPLLRPHARIVNISSALGHLTKINAKRLGAEELKQRFSDPQLTEGDLTALLNDYIQSVKDGTQIKAGWPNSAYAISKIAVCALTRTQQREMDAVRPEDDILVNSVHPGWIKSDMTGGRGLYSTQEGAVAPVWAALLPPNPPGHEECPRGSFIWRDLTLVDWVNGPLPSTL